MIASTGCRLSSQYTDASHASHTPAKSALCRCQQCLRMQFIIRKGKTLDTPEFQSFIRSQQGNWGRISELIHGLEVTTHIRCVSLPPAHEGSHVPHCNWCSCIRRAYHTRHMSMHPTTGSSRTLLCASGICGWAQVGGSRRGSDTTGRVIPRRG